MVLLSRPKPDYIEEVGDARFGGADQEYRYELSRILDPAYDRHRDPFIAWVMLNPSTADSMLNDPTITRCVGFSRECGFKAMFVGNLYALRSTRPDVLWCAPDPVGPENFAVLKAILQASVEHGGLVVVAWGTHAREADVDGFRALRDEVGASTWCLGVNQGGSPKHPLYIPAGRAFERWQ